MSKILRDALKQIVDMKIEPECTDPTLVISATCNYIALVRQIAQIALLEEGVSDLTRRRNIQPIKEYACENTNQFGDKCTESDPCEEHCPTHEYDSGEGFTCLGCGKEGAEEVMSAAYDRAKAQRQDGDA